MCEDDDRLKECYNVVQIITLLQRLSQFTEMAIDIPASQIIDCGTHSDGMFALRDDRRVYTGRIMNVFSYVVCALLNRFILFR